MIIGSDIMHDLNIDLLFSEEIIRWGSAQNPFDYDSITMEEMGVVSDTDVYSMIYNLNTTSPILQQEEEQQGKILDDNYSKVDIDVMVNVLEIAKETNLK